ncbi:hypothetical protein AW736_26260 [Termitidicoccus mucosus]|uniref:Uncharacterized protein n=1 Tax=Termitidicoccus mucosus TaxID=1184151 RepID=A0A178IRM4_9BACT|nr:hypothetical protein AW736_26260 [Opitutaceae bacterium TSB47]
MPKIITETDITAAVAQLNKSEKGQMALFWIGTGATDFLGLDLENQRALETLLLSIFAFPGTSRDIIEEDGQRDQLWTHNRRIAEAVESVVKRAESSAAEPNGDGARASIRWLANWCMKHREASTAAVVRSILRSIHNSSQLAPFGRLGFVDDEITAHLMVVIDATIGRQAGQLHDTDIREAFVGIEGGETWFFADTGAPETP